MAKPSLAGMPAVNVPMAATAAQGHQLSQAPAGMQQQQPAYDPMVGYQPLDQAPQTPPTQPPQPPASPRSPTPIRACRRCAI